MACFSRFSACGCFVDVVHIRERRRLDDCTGTRSPPTRWRRSSGAGPGGLAGERGSKRRPLLRRAGERLLSDRPRPLGLLRAAPADRSAVRASRCWSPGRWSGSPSSARSTRPLRGHSDSETAADRAAARCARRGLAGKRLGLEMAAGLSNGLATGWRTRLEALAGCLGARRRAARVKSPEEQALMRAAAVSARGGGGRDRGDSPRRPRGDVAAACCAAMIRAGGDRRASGPSSVRGASRRGAHDLGRRPLPRRRAGLPGALGCVARYHAPLGRLVRIGAVARPDARWPRRRAGVRRGRRRMRPGARRGGLRRLAGVVDDAGPYALPPPSLRLPGGHRRAAVLDRGERA